MFKVFGKRVNFFVPLCADTDLKARGNALRFADFAGGKKAQSSRVMVDDVAKQNQNFRIL